MTWSTNASGHHSSSEWRSEEHEILRKLIEAYEVKDTVVSTFAFQGNHISVHSLAEAKTVLEEYDKG